MSKPALFVYLVRHGETDENRLGVIQGQLDTELNDAGRLQAKTVGRALQKVPFSHAFSSDSHRAMDVGSSKISLFSSAERNRCQTAKAILEFHPSVLLIPSERLRERVSSVTVCAFENAGA